MQNGEEQGHSPGRAAPRRGRPDDDCHEQPVHITRPASCARFAPAFQFTEQLTSLSDIPLDQTVLGLHIQLDVTQCCGASSLWLSPSVTPAVFGLVPWKQSATHRSMPHSQSALGPRLDALEPPPWKHASKRHPPPSPAVPRAVHGRQGPRRNLRALESPRTRWYMLPTCRAPGRDCPSGTTRHPPPCAAQHTHHCAARPWHPIPSCP